jgi:hypothetical protein
MSPWCLGVGERVFQWKKSFQEKTSFSVKMTSVWPAGYRSIKISGAKLISGATEGDGQNRQCVQKAER